MNRLALLVTLLAPAPLLAQRLTPASFEALLTVSSAPDHRFDRVLADSVRAIAPSYWLEGGVIGAITTGVLGTLFFRGMSDTRPSAGATIGIAALSGAVGFAPGALIGSVFHKAKQS